MPVLYGARWLDGFLQGSSLLLLCQPELWRLLDDWTGALPEADFQETLPLLRRAFSRFSGPEREKILAQASVKIAPEDRPPAPEWDPARAQAVEALLEILLSD